MIIKAGGMPNLGDSIKRLVSEGRWSMVAFERGEYLITIPHEGCCNQKSPDGVHYYLVDDQGNVLEGLKHRPMYDVRDVVTHFEDVRFDPDEVKMV